MGASARSNRIALFIDGPRPAASVTKKALDHYKAYPWVNTTTIAQLRMQQFALADNPDPSGSLTTRGSSTNCVRRVCRRVERGGRAVNLLQKHHRNEPNVSIGSQNRKYRRFHVVSVLPSRTDPASQERAARGGGGADRVTG